MAVARPPAPRTSGQPTLEVHRSSLRSHDAAADHTTAQRSTETVREPATRPLDITAGRLEMAVSRPPARAARVEVSARNATPSTFLGTASATLLGRDMAIDLGTANTLVYVRGRGVVLDEPSVVAVNTDTRAIVAIGTEAKQMIGRTPANVTAIRPLKDGVITDLETTERMLRYFLQKVNRRRHLAKPRLVVCVPSGVTSVEQRAVRDVGYQAGSRKVFIIEESMAAAIGAGLPISEARGSMIVDIGGGTTEVAVLSLGGIVTSQSVRVGGDELDEAIVTYVKREYSLLLGERTAEQIKMSVGSAFPYPDEPHAEIRGRDLVTGLPKTIAVSAAEIRRALEEPLAAILDAVKATLDKCPPELSGDVMDRGMVLTGGGALLHGMQQRLAHETGMRVHRAAHPLHSVALGSGRCIEDFERLRRVLIVEPRH